MYTIVHNGKVRFVVNGCVYTSLADAIEARNSLYHNN